MTQLSLGGLGGIALSPDMLEEQRGAWCSPEEYTRAAGHYDLDPFTNPRSTLHASYMCMLENGGDGFGGVIIKKPPRGQLASSAEPGKFHIRAGERFTLCQCEHCSEDRPIVDFHEVATEEWKVWIQPDYAFVLEALAHYGHTRFTALLRLDTSTVWFAQLWELSEAIMVPKNDRLAFVPPPGVRESSNPFPHGLFYKRAEDVTPAIRDLCYPWPCPAYPWHVDPLNIFAA